MAKTWTERLNASTRHEVKPAPISIAGMKAGEIMLVPSCTIVDAFIRGIPRGRGMSVKTLRQRLARKFQAEVTCPITTGYHQRTVAEAAWEAHQRGAPVSEITPFWRVLDETTPTTVRLACGADFVVRQRRREKIAPTAT